MQEMDALINEKCVYYDDSVKAYNSVLIEWIDCHEEFEYIIDKNSFSEYQNMKNKNGFIDFLSLLYKVKLPSERKVRVRPKPKGTLIRDESSIQLPNFKKNGCNL